MTKVTEIVDGLQKPDLNERDKIISILYKMLRNDEKPEFSNDELNQIIPSLAKAFIEANLTSEGLHRRSNYSHILELIIQKTKSRKNVEKAFNELSEELISNQSNIIFPDDFLIIEGGNRNVFPFPHSANIEKIVQSILEKDLSGYTEKGYFFVLMPFSHDFDDIYKFGIKGLLENYKGIYCQRADEIFHLEDIPTKIFKEIQRAEYIIADLTGKNPNVFYELGFAQGINKKNIILITRNRDDVPFDLRNIRNIEYVNSENLQLQLKEIVKKFGFKLREL